MALLILSGDSIWFETLDILGDESWAFPKNLDGEDKGERDGDREFLLLFN